MRLTRRRSREYTTPVRKYEDGWGFEMSPGVIVLVQPQTHDTDEFAKKLAETIQRVAHTTWV